MAEPGVLFWDDLGEVSAMCLHVSLIPGCGISAVGEFMQKKASLPVGAILVELVIAAVGVIGIPALLMFL